jgi:hypothetical protein
MYVKVDSILALRRETITDDVDIQFFNRTVVCY